MDLFRLQRSFEEEDDTNYQSNPTPAYHEYEPVENPAEFRNNLLIINAALHTVFTLVLSILSVSFFIFILVRKELRNTPTCWFVLSVLLGLMVDNLVVLPVSLVTFQTGWHGGRVPCVIFILVQHIVSMHIPSSLMLLMVDRLIYFLKQKEYTETMTPRKVRILLIVFAVLEVILVMSFVLAGMPELMQIDENKYYCYTSTDWLTDLIFFQISQALPNLTIILLGFITFVCTLCKCHVLSEGNADERARSKHAVTFNIVIGALVLFLWMPLGIRYLRSIGNLAVWLLATQLSRVYHVIMSILIMVLVTDIRNEMVCCKKNKLDESSPLIKPL